jgi:hypothetical protein
MILQYNIQLLHILSNIKEKNNKYTLYCILQFKYCDQFYEFKYNNIIETNKESLENFLIKYLNKFDSKFK